MCCRPWSAPDAARSICGYGTHRCTPHRATRASSSRAPGGRMSEGNAVMAVVPSLEPHSSRLEQRIRALTEQLVQVRGELRRAEEQIAALRTIDEATGLLNARAFLERALVEVDRASRYERPLALVLL